MIFIRKGKKFVSKQGQSQPDVHSEVRVTCLITIIWSILKNKNDKVYDRDSSVVITPEKSL